MIGRRFCGTADVAGRWRFREESARGPVINSERADSPHPSLIFISRAAAVAVVLLGCLALVGWIFDIRILKSVFPGFVTMKANTAL